MSDELDPKIETEVGDEATEDSPIEETLPVEELEDEVSDKIVEDVSTLSKKAPIVPGPTPISIKLPIVEDFGEHETSPYPGNLVMPNHTRKELAAWFSRLVERIRIKQDARVAMSDEKLTKGGYMYWHLSEDSSLVVTADEADILNNIRDSMRLLYNGTYEHDIFHDPNGATNLPKISDKKGAMPPVILGITNDKNSTTSSILRRKLSLSIDRMVPLWSSGFRVELTGAGNLDLLNLETKILMDKIDISTETYGYALSSYNIYMDRILIDFILDQVGKSTAGTTDPRTLKRLISLADFDILTLGMASTIFPDGYPMERAMFRKTVEGVSSIKRNRKLNVWRMKIVRDSHFTQEQKDRINIVSGNIPREELDQHREGIRPEVERFVDVGNDVYIKLHTPTLDEYLRIGLKFATGMEEHAKRVLGSEMDEDQRGIYLQRASDISRVMYLSHWVEGIYFKEGPEGDMIPSVVRVKGVDATEEDIRSADKEIAKVLEDISVFPSKADHLLDEIEKYIDRMRLAFAIIPREPNTIVEKGEHPHVITISPAEVFFTLLHHKIQMAGG